MSIPKEERIAELTRRVADLTELLGSIGRGYQHLVDAMRALGLMMDDAREQIKRTSDMLTRAREEVQAEAEATDA